MNEHEFDDLFRRKIVESKGTSPDVCPEFEDVWKDIETGLNPRRQKLKFMYIVGIAATVCIIIIAGALFYGQKLSDEEITYRQEIVVLDEMPEENSGNMEREALIIIEQNCLILQAICEEEDFVRLKEQLNELNNKSEEIRNELKLFGPSPAILKAQIKVENVRSDIIKELLKIQGNG